MTFLKRYSILFGLVVFAGLYYLLASQSILQFLRVIPSELFHVLNAILIGLTRPLTRALISISAFFTGLIIRRKKAELWSESLLLICVASPRYSRHLIALH